MRPKQHMCPAGMCCQPHSFSGSAWERTDLEAPPPMRQKPPHAPPSFSRSSFACARRHRVHQKTVYACSLCSFHCKAAPLANTCHPEVHRRSCAGVHNSRRTKCTGPNVQVQEFSLPGRIFSLGELLDVQRDPFPTLVFPPSVTDKGVVIREFNEGVLPKMKSWSNWEVRRNLGTSTLV